MTSHSVFATGTMMSKSFKDAFSDIFYYKFIMKGARQNAILSVEYALTRDTVANAVFIEPMINVFNAATSYSLGEVGIYE